MKKMSKLFCGLLAATMLFTGVSFLFTSNISEVKAAEADYSYEEVVDDLPTGDLLKGKEYHFSNSDLKKISSIKYQGNHVLASYYGASETYKWTGYGSDYFYGKMSAKQKAFYKELQKVCQKYLNKKTNCSSSYDSDYGTFYYLDPVSSSLSRTDAIRVLQVFAYSNPQYYFLDHGYVSGYSSGYVYALTAYPQFANGSTRMTCTKKVNNTINSWVKQIKKQSSLMKKITKAQALVCNKVNYANSTYDQSAYSVFCDNKSVCAGYSSAFTVICEAAGIDTLILTSSLVGYEHEWNMVKIHGNWYNMDVTWDDLDNQYDLNGDGKADSYYYEYTLRNDQNFIYDYNYRNYQMLDSYYSHYPESIWSSYSIPKAKLDTSPSESSMYMSAGSIKTLDKPTSVKLKKASKGVTVSWKKVSGAKYYIVERKVSGGSWKVVAKKCKSTSYTDTSAKSGKKYSYRITAMKNSKTVKNYSATKTIKR